ncbi:Leucine-rich repeats and immunoglobulin-like domains protein 2 [Eumeta japonica]|uniref:Hemolin n=1 Tax=Eumeta variegata TaxID=151549 RepID=A0A4C1X5P1_EUMVA|nr:Leucine-rich repeats and immunoglobulin-like domains protein 2 [Eumeta japonica]
MRNYVVTVLIARPSVSDMCSNKGVRASKTTPVIWRCVSAVADENVTKGKKLALKDRRLKRSKIDGDGSVTNIKFIALYAAYILLPVLACPMQCMCKWKNGKRYVECVDKDLKQIPTMLDPETQVLDFGGNDLQVLQKEAFQKLGLSDLQKIYLPRCRIHKVDNHAFKDLANLVELDLSHNYLTVVPSTNFIYFPTLMRLSLSHNPITTIKRHCFQHLSHLNTLELSECKIELIESEAFSGLNHLEWLRLDGNKLANIQGEHIFPDSLRGVELQNNNWICDCRLKDIYDWLMNFNMPHTVEPRCSAPDRLARRKITNVVAAELACVPRISPTSVFLESNEGNNVTLECQVKAIPEAKIYWLFQGQIVHNESSTMALLKIKYVLEEGSMEKKSNLYLFNVSEEDNGTYTCIAENPAGKSQSNFSLKIIIKEEPVVVVVTFPQKHFLIIITGVFLIIVLVFAIIAVVLLKFRTDTKNRKKHESSKDVALRNQNVPTIRENVGHTFDTLQPKSNTTFSVNAQAHHVLHYNIQTGNNEMYLGNVNKFSERNPDLITDAESLANNAQNENSGLTIYSTTNATDTFDEEPVISISNTAPRQVTWQDQQKCVNSANLIPNNLNNLYQHSADVHLNPGCFLDNDGYPYDYGLPKLPCRPLPMHIGVGSAGPFYQTLPHNRSKIQKFPCKFSKDNEFNVSPHSQNYEQYNNGHVRHTLEGYPYAQNRHQIAFVGNGTLFYTEQNFVPSPPEGYKSESINQCCGEGAGEPCQPWVSTRGTCAVMVPAPAGHADAGAGRCYHVETRCVDTQTNNGRLHGDNGENLKSIPKNVNANGDPENCSESPDEGYVGEGTDGADT